MATSELEEVKTAPADRPNHFPFLKLPGELRNAVYEDVLLSDTAITIQKVDIKSLQVPIELNHLITAYKPKRLHTAIICTSGKIYSETASMLYSNHFTIENYAALKSFLALIGNQKEHICEITLRNVDIPTEYLRTYRDELHDHLEMSTMHKLQKIQFSDRNFPFIGNIFISAIFWSWMMAMDRCHGKGTAVSRMSWVGDKQDPH